MNESIGVGVRKKKEICANFHSHTSYWKSESHGSWTALCEDGRAMEVQGLVPPTPTASGILWE